VLQDGGHKVDRLPDAGRAKAASGQIGNPSRQVLEGDAVELDRAPGGQDVKAQKRCLLVPGLRLSAGPRFEPAGSVLAECDPAACRIDPFALGHLRALLS
jgi:hypothetical protein